MSAEAAIAVVGMTPTTPKWVGCLQIFGG